MEDLGTEKCPHGVWDYEDECYECKIDALKREIEKLEGELEEAQSTIIYEVFGLSNQAGGDSLIDYLDKHNLNDYEAAKQRKAKRE